MANRVLQAFYIRNKALEQRSTTTEESFRLGNSVRKNKRQRFASQDVAHLSESVRQSSSHVGYSELTSALQLPHPQNSNSDMLYVA